MLVPKKDIIIKPAAAAAKAGHKPRPVFFLYALLCSNDSIYIGLTKDLAARWLQHRRGRGGARWTRLHPPIEMFYSEAVKGGLKKAMARERQLKTSTFRKKLRKFLITGITPPGLKPCTNRGWCNDKIM
jgi:putative endonuclease